MIFETILTAVVSSLVSGGMVGVFAQRWMDHSFNVRLSEIEAKNRILAHEHQVRFTRYDQKVAKAIEDMHALVCEYAEAATESISRSELDQEAELHEQVLALAKKFGYCMHRQSIYLPEDVVQKLISARISIRDAYTLHLNQDFQKRQKRDDGERASILVGVYRVAGFQRDVDEALSELHALIRSHLSRFTASD